MDGKLAVLFWLMSLPSGEVLTDGFNVSRYDAHDTMVFSAGNVVFQEQNIGQELRFTYMLDHVWGRFNPILDVSITNAGGAWAGLGLYQQFDFDFGGQQIFAGLTFAPGIYMQGNEVDLGGPLEFRSGLEFGVKFNHGWQASVSYDHRSNADFGPINPGLETLQLRISKQFN